MLGMMIYEMLVPTSFNVTFLKAFEALLWKCTYLFSVSRKMQKI